MNTHNILRPCVALLLLAFLAGAGALYAQDEPPEVTQYREDYERYEKIKVMKDAAARADALVAFLRERPNSRLLKHAQASFLEALDALHKEKKFDATIPRAEAFVKLFPRVGEPYYFYGFALKEAGRNDEAMNALAKCYLLKIPASQRAKRLLDYIYKNQHGNLDGLNEVISKARAELGT